MRTKPFVFRNIEALEVANDCPTDLVLFKLLVDPATKYLFIGIAVYRKEFLFSQVYGAVGPIENFDQRAYTRLVRFTTYLKEDTMAKLSNLDILKMRLQVLDALRRERNITITVPDFDNISTWINDLDEEILSQLVTHLERLLHIAPVNR